jgi:hypothetical protein
MTAYAKGEAPRNLDAACGGPTLTRVRDFQKSQDVGMNGPPNKQDYSAKGSPAKRTGDKCLAPIKPRS